MKAARVSEIRDDLAGVAVVDVPEPGDPGPGEALVRVRAAAWNFPDALAAQGRYQLRPDLPFTLGMEFAGEIVALGENTGAWKVGDAAMGNMRFGAAAEMARVATSALRAVPPGWSWAEAAAFPVAAMTAWVALARRGGLRAGERALVLGAGGGVGLALVEVARALGARVMAITSPGKASYVRARGAEKIWTQRTGFREAALAWSRGEGVNLVADPVGGDAFDEAVRCLAPEGRALTLGFASTRAPTLRANYALIKEISLIGVRAGAFHRRRGEAEHDADWRALEALIAADALRPPHIDALEPLENARATLQALLRGEARGKRVAALTEDADAVARDDLTPELEEEN